MKRENFRKAVRENITTKFGGVMKVRFTNRNGKLYCKVIDQRPLSDYSADLSLQVMNIMKDNGAGMTYLSSGGSGRYTYRFWYQPEEI